MRLAGERVYSSRIIPLGVWGRKVKHRRRRLQHGPDRSLHGIEVGGGVRLRAHSPPDRIPDVLLGLNRRSAALTRLASPTSPPGLVGECQLELPPTSGGASPGWKSSDTPFMQ